MTTTGAQDQAQIYPVLIVEDDADLLDTAVTALQDYGYDVTGVESLAEAFAEVEQRTFRLVLCDLFASSARDPLASVDELRERAHPTPVGVMTSWKVTAAEAEAHGCAFLLPKPFELDDLFARVGEAVKLEITAEQEQEAALARSYFDALTRRDWAAVAALCADDVEFGPFGAATLLPTLRGRPAVADYLAQALGRYPGARFDEIAVYATPRGLSARYTERWPSTNGRTEHRQSGAVVFGFASGRIARIAVRLNEERLRSVTRSRPLKPR